MGIPTRRQRMALLYLAVVVCPLASCFADLVAWDNADNDPYPASGFLPGDNGGFGFTPWVVLESGVPGAMFTATAIDEGAYSWGLSGTYALGRGLVSARSSGSWRFLAVHNPQNTGFSGFNLRTSTNVGGGFADYEVLRFGFDPSQPGYDGTGIYFSTNGGASYSFWACGWVDGAGDTLEYSIAWGTGGTWWLTISNQDEGVISTLSGSLTAPASVAMLGVAVFGASNDESLTFDDFTVIPEPQTTIFLLLGLGALRRRLQNARWSLTARRSFR